MQPAAKRLAFICGCQALATVLSLVLCQVWIMRALNRIVGFAQAWEIHDVFAPGEQKTYLAAHAVTAFVYTIIVVAVASRSTGMNASRRLAMFAALPSVICGDLVFEDFIRPHLTEVLVPFPPGELCLPIFLGLLVAAAVRIPTPRLEI